MEPLFLTGRGGFRPIFWLTVGTETGLCVTLRVAKYSMFNGKLSHLNSGI